MTDPIEAQKTPPAGIPPASANPAIVDLAARIAAAMIPTIIGVLMTGPMIPPPGGFVPPPAPPPPPPPPPPPGPIASLDSRFTVIGQWDLVSPTITSPPPGPMASMDAADLHLRADTMEIA